MSSPPIKWELVGDESTSPAPWPAPRWAHTVTPAPGGAILFGGFADKVYRNDAWLLTGAGGGGAAAARLRPSDAPPAAALPGGDYEPADAAASGADAYYPSARSNHAAFALDGAVIIVGGAMGKKRLGDAYALLAGGGAGAPALASARLVADAAAPAASAEAAAAVLASGFTFAAGAQLNKQAFIVVGGLAGTAAGEFSGALVGALGIAPSVFARAAVSAGSSSGSPSVARVPPQAVKWAVCGGGGGGANAPRARKCHVMAAAPAAYASPSVGRDGSEPASIVLLHGGCFSEAYTPLDDAWLLMPLSAAVAAKLAAGRAAPPADLITVPGGAERGARLAFAWVRPREGGARPSARWGHALTPIPGRPPTEPAFLLVGGYGGAPGPTDVRGGGGGGAPAPQADLNDVFVVTALVGADPAAAEAHAARGSFSAPADLVPPVDLAWSSVKFSVPFPARRRLGGAALAGGRLIIFGGYANLRYFSDLWAVPTDDVLFSVGVPRFRERAAAAPPAAAGGGGGGGAAAFGAPFGAAPPGLAAAASGGFGGGGPPAYLATSLPPASRAAAPAPAVAVDAGWARRQGGAGADADSAGLWQRCEAAERKVGAAAAAEAELLEALAKARSDGRAAGEALAATAARLRAAEADVARASADLAAAAAELAAERQHAAALAANLAATDKELRATKLMLFQKESELDRKGRCIACEDAPKSIVTLPCKHMTLCKGCYDELVRRQKEKVAAVPPPCPVCNAAIKSSFEVFI